MWCFYGKEGAVLQFSTTHILHMVCVNGKHDFKSFLNVPSSSSDKVFFRVEDVADAFGDLKCCEEQVST